jgi:hypothetical protein
MCIEKVENKTRDRVIADCTMAAVAAWQHYVDAQLTEVCKINIRTALDTVLPTEVTTENWRSASQQYVDECVLEEN